MSAAAIATLRTAFAQRREHAEFFGIVSTRTRRGETKLWWQDAFTRERGGLALCSKDAELLATSQALLEELQRLKAEAQPKAKGAAA